jgi:hypothetical protein
MNRVIDQLQVVSTNNYNTIIISTLYSSLEHRVYCSQSVTRHFLLTAPTLAIPLPPAQVLSSQTPVRNWLNWPGPLLIIFRQRPHRKHGSSIVVFMSVAAGTCLQSCCPEMALVYPSMPRSLHSNGSYMLQYYISIPYKNKFLQFKFIHDY